MSRHQPFGCARCATSCAGVSLNMRGCVKSGCSAEIASRAGLLSVAGTAGSPSNRRRHTRP